MLAEDVRPDRLERAKLAILDFLQTHPGGRVGLVVFAGQAFLQCPLTFDHEAFRESLLAVDANTIPVGGTDLGRALNEAMQAVENPQDNQIMILLSDGENTRNRWFNAEGAINARQKQICDNIKAAGITINGLAILNDDIALDLYYAQHVIGGSDAFVMTARDFEDFAQAMRRKLLREIRGVPVG